MSRDTVNVLAEPARSKWLLCSLYTSTTPLSSNSLLYSHHRQKPKVLFTLLFYSHQLCAHALSTLTDLFLSLFYHASYSVSSNDQFSTLPPIKSKLSLSHQRLITNYSELTHSLTTLIDIKKLNIDTSKSIYKPSLTLLSISFLNSFNH